MPKRVYQQRVSKPAMMSHGVQIVAQGETRVIDILGPKIAFVTDPLEECGDYCVMIGTLPPGVTVPLHSHPDFETFFILSGRIRVLSEAEDGFRWQEARNGEFVHVPGGRKHSFRNETSEPVLQLITTTARLGRFFQEIGRPVIFGQPLPRPCQEDYQRLAVAARKYGHWLASPEENAALGSTTAV